MADLGCRMGPTSSGPTASPQRTPFRRSLHGDLLGAPCQLLLLGKVAYELQDWPIAHLASSQAGFVKDSQILPYILCPHVVVCSDNPTKRMVESAPPLFP